MNRAVFLDRDGVINEIIYDYDVGILSPIKLDDFRILPRVKEAIEVFNELGLKTVVVSNQPQIAKCNMDVSVLTQIDDIMRKEVGIDAVYNCIHHPEIMGECECRKPKPGLIRQAAKELDIDIKESYIIGDRVTDLLAGRECKTKIMIGILRCDACKVWEEHNIYPDFIAKDLFEASQFIKKIESRGGK